ncbi:MAG TPA: hypothetical protein VFW73_11340 [Lacipirellulaceae bacterium]|nr:hypothetical protein [Lacipirellulaceae bacterium]
MNNVAKLSLAVVLALIAAVLNAMWLSAEKRPTMYVAASTDLASGKAITDAMLAPVPVPGNPDTLRASLIPYANRAILIGRPTPRTYIRGDMFFERDVKAPMELAKFDVLGPFKLISVGSRFTQPNSKQDESQLDAGGNNITIAVDAKFDERTRRLLQIIESGRSSGSATRIIAIQVIPKDEQSAPPPPDDKNVVFQTIQLDGIANVPRVLLAGDVIRFVIPANDSP